MKNKWLKISAGFLVLSFFSGGAAYAQSDWRVSDAQAKIQNPVPSNEASIKAGEALFMTNCKTCHGDPGKGNGLPLVPKPTDMSNAEFLSLNSDGAIYTKISDGRIAMPTFKAVLSETQRWDLVNYIRSHDKNKVATVAPVVVKPVEEKPKILAPYQLSLTYNTEQNELMALVEGTSPEGTLVPAPGVEVGFFMKRYFGKLPFGDAGAVSDENGLLTAVIPVDLPGGEEGKALAYVALTDADTFGNVSAEAEVNVKPVEIVNLLKHRSLWTVRVMAPWWLIITYFSILIGVWSTLAYIVFQLFKLKKAGV